MLKFFLARFGCAPLSFCGTRLADVSGKRWFGPGKPTPSHSGFTLDKSGHRTRLRPHRFRDRHATRLQRGLRFRVRQHRRGC